MPLQNAQPRLGLIGLGLVGHAMAGRFLKGGFEVVGWDVNEVAREALVAKGGTIAAGVAGVFAQCERILLSLPNSQVVRRVLGEGMPREGQVIVDTSTGDPEDAVVMAGEVAARGGRYVDATISGSSAQVAAGAVTVMAGGEAAAVEACRDVFACLGPRVFHVGPAGSGAKMKLVTNLVLGLNRAALAEGLTLARVLGLEARQALEVMMGSMAYSRIMETKGGKMIEGDFKVQAKLTQHLKDVRLMIEAAETDGVKLPLSEAHRGLLEKAEAMGCGELDNSAVIRAYSS